MDAMKQPTQMWQLIISVAAVLLSCFAGIINQSNKIASLRTDLENVKIQQFNQQMASDKKFDKMDLKIDLIQADTRQILINLQNKADRKN